jgi:cobalt-zinc-cadmium efflux system membrane fusion protein
LTGTVVRVGGEVEQASRAVEVRVELDNPAGRLLPGLSATAWLPLGEEGAEVLTVPTAAVQRLPAGWCVFLPRDESLFEVRVIGRGRDLEGEVEVISGLERGETVVVEGAFLLKAQAERQQGGGGHHDH